MAAAPPLCACEELGPVAAKTAAAGPLTGARLQKGTCDTGPAAEALAALAGWLGWGIVPYNNTVEGLIPGLGTERRQPIDVCVSLSLKINKHILQ